MLLWSVLQNVCEWGQALGERAAAVQCTQHSAWASGVQAASTHGDGSQGLIYMRQRVRVLLTHAH